LQLGIAVAAYDYEAQNDQELSFQVGDEIDISAHHEDGWSTGTLNGVTGLVSPSFLTFSSNGLEHEGDSYTNADYVESSEYYQEEDDDEQSSATAASSSSSSANSVSIDARKAKRKMMLEQRNCLRSDAEALTNERKALEEEVRTLENTRDTLVDTVDKLSHLRHANDYAMELVKLSMLLDSLTSMQQQYQSTSRELEGELKTLRAILVKDLKSVVGVLDEPKNDLATSSVELMQCYAEHEGKIIQWWTNKLEFHQKLEQLRAALVS
jgi:hypothetical protein